MSMNNERVTSLGFGRAGALRARSTLATLAALTALAGGALAGCAEDVDDDVEAADEDVEAAELAFCNGTPTSADLAKEGKRLFRQETFGGNGRTCTTCHDDGSGTVSPADAQARFAANPEDPLFRWDALDDFQSGTTRILADATILVNISLPPNITVAGDPTATKVTVRRGIPSTKNTPALDPVLMQDGRAPSLTGQALGAIHGHAQNTIEPTAAQLQLIADHERTEKFFTSYALKQFAAGGPAPTLPLGSSPAQQRGRLFFLDAPQTPALSSQSPRKGLCATCHSGPMLNQTNGKGFLPLPPFPTPPATTVCNQPAQQANPVPAGRRFDSVLVSELNIGNNPLLSLMLHLPNGAVVPLPPMSDPGRALITGNFKRFPDPDGDLFKFKIPSLWGVKKTAPYFHDNSAKTLEALVDHYATFFQLATDCNIDGDPPLILTAQDKADLVAYLKLL